MRQHQPKALLLVELLLIPKVLYGVEPVSLTMAVMQ
jgi:hypothetical protein